MSEKTKKCPYCVEEIKKDAIKCKHCGSEIKNEDNKKNKISKSGYVPPSKNEKKVLSILGKIILIIIGIYIWYVSIPLFIIWYVWKKTKWNKKKKYIGTGASIILLFLLVGVYSYINRDPVLNIIEPESNELKSNISVESEDIRIIGNFKPKNSTFSINGIVISTNNGEFDYLAKLDKEINSFVIEVDNKNNKTSEEIIINRIFTEEEIAEIQRIKDEEEKERERIAQEKKAEELNNRKDQLQREIDSIDSFDNSTYRGSIDGLTVQLALFKVWASYINEAKNDDNQEIKDLGQKLENKVKQLQSKEFPLMRKEYGKLVTNILWEHDIDVSVYGNKNETIEFIGGIFAANKNIKDVHTTLIEMLNLLRFDRANYKWYEYDSNYTYYEIKSYLDNEIVL